MKAKTSRPAALAALALSAAAFAAPAVARAASEPLAIPTSEPGRPAVDAAEPPARRFPTGLAAGMGLRLAFTPDPGLAPYVPNGAIPELSMYASMPVVRAGRFSLAAHVEWDFGTTAAEARSDTATLWMHRLAGGLEARYALATRLYGFARLAPSAIYVGAAIDDPAAADRPLYGGGWTWGLDTTAGGALMLAGSAQSTLHLWLVAEAGYSFTGAVAMNVAPDPAVDDPRRFGTVALPDARVQGAIGSLSFALAF